MGKVGTLWIVLDTKLDAFNRGMSDAQRSMVSVGRKFTAIGKNLTKFVTLPILALGVVSVKAFADFDKAMTESLAIMGPVSDSMRQKMADVAKTISEKTTFAASELAESYYFLASAGMTAEQSVAALDKVAKFAQAGAFDLATATDLLTDAQTAMGLSSKDAIKNQENLVRVSDVLVGANTLANASVQQFSEALTNMAAAALTNVNKGLEEGVAILTVFADKGIKGQKAGMKLSMMLNALDKAASKNKKAWKEYNVQLWDSQGNMRHVGDIIGDLERAFKDLTPEAKAAALAELGFDVRVKNSILALMGSSEQILQNTENLKKMGGTTDEVANKQMAAFSNQLTVVKNMLVNVGAEIGEVLVPVLKNLIDNHIKPAIKWFKGLSDGQKETIVRVAGLAAALGPLMLVFGKLLTVIPKISKALKVLAANPIMLIITGLVIIAEKTRQAINTFKNFSESLNKYLDASGKKMGWLEKTWAGVTATIHKHVYGVNVAKIATKKYAEMTDTARKKQAELAKTTLDAIKKTGLHTKAIDSLKNAFGFLIPKIKDIKDVKEDLDGVTKALSKTIKTIIPKIKDERTAVEKLEAEYWDLMATVFKGEVGWQTFINQAVEIKGKLKALKEPLSDLDMAIEDDAEEWIDLGDKVTGVLEGMGYGIGSIPEDVEEATGKTKSLWDEMADDLQAKWASTISSILTEAGNLKEKLSSMFDAIKTQFADMAGAAISKWMTTTAGMTAAAVAFAAYVSVNLVSHVLKAFGIIKDNWDDIWDELEKAREIPSTDTGTKKRLQEEVEATNEWTAAIDELDKHFRLFNETGEMTLEGMKLLDDAWANMIGLAKKYGMEGSKAFVDMIKLMQEMGLESQALTGYINDQLGLIKSGGMNAAEGLEAMAGAIPLDKIAKLEEKQAALLETMQGVDPASDRYKRLKSTLDKVQQKIVGFTDQIKNHTGSLESQTLAVFNAMIANGASYGEAMEAVGGTLDQLILAHEKAGTTGSEAIQELLKIREVQDTHKSLFTAIEGNRGVLEALGNIGVKSQEALSTAATQATRHFNQLKNSGLDSNQAMAQMGPTLESLRDYADTYGLELDENTEKLITQGTEMGLLKGKKKTAIEEQEAMFETLGDTIGDIMDDLGTRIEDIFGEAFGDSFSDAVTEAGKTRKSIEKEFKGMSATVEIDGDFSKLDKDTKKYRTPAEPGGGKTPTFQHGGLVEKTGLAYVHEGEWVLPKISVPQMNFPGSMSVQPISRHREPRGESAMNTTVNIYAQKLDDYTINTAAEKIFAAVERQEARRGGR